MTIYKLRLLSLIALALGAPSAQAAEDLGARSFRKCQSCHMVGEQAKLRTGPPLNGVVDAPKGGLEGYRYSRVLTEAHQAGEIWTREELDAFLENPRERLKGTRMAFAGIRDPEERAALIDWLAGFDKQGERMEAAE